MTQEARAIDQQLEGLEPEIRALLDRHGFDRAHFTSLAQRLRRGFSSRVSGAVRPPEPGDITELPPQGGPLRADLMRRGLAALKAGECAIVVLAGGMATRMGGAVKALVEALPGKTFLDFRLAEQTAIERALGRLPPLWLMTSHATDAPIRRALEERRAAVRVGVFTQRLSLRLTESGELFCKDGQPSLYAPGHGDVIDALRDGGLLHRFVASGGRSVFITNLDNLAGTLDPAILGFHLSHGHPVTSEVVDRLPSDRGGLPVRVDGALQVLEEPRLPADFDPASVGVFNINSFWIDAACLLDQRPSFSDVAVRKQVDGANAVQFERLLNELCASLPSRFLHVPRRGGGCRFLPVKDAAELERHRPWIAAGAAFRGLFRPEQPRVLR